MKPRTVVLLVAPLALALGVASTATARHAGQARWLVHDLGASSRGKSSASAISSRGVIVGSSTGAGGVMRAVRWDGGVMTILPSLVGAEQSVALALNEHGLIVGESGWRPVLWRSGKAVELPRLPGPLGSLASQSYRALGVDDQGVVFGMTTGQFSDGTSRALVWRNGRVTGIGDDSHIRSWETSLDSPFGALRTPFAVAITRHGAVAGSCCTKKDLHAFVWQAGRRTDLVVPPGTRASAANGINRRGVVVGFALFGSNGTSHALVWDGGHVRRLPPPRGSSWEEADAVNDHGLIAGASFIGDHARATVWQKGRPRVIGPKLGDSYPLAITNRGQVLIRNDRNPSFGDLSLAYIWENGKLTRLPGLGGSYTVAAAINEHNQAVGFSETQSGHEHAVVWTWN